MSDKSICEQFQEWARQAVDEWDGLHTAELFTLILEKTGETVQAVFADGREPTTNERHLLNLLSWRTQEAGRHREEIDVLTDQLQSWRNLCGKYKELAQARGEALAKMRHNEGQP